MRLFKKALIVGIDKYGGGNDLPCCVQDAASVAAILETNGDGSSNFAVKLGKNIPDRSQLMEELDQLFKYEADIALFYFSGHGFLDHTGGYIVTPDSQKYDMGISMDAILHLAAHSPVKNKIIILDCCNSGAFGNPELAGGNQALIVNGLTVLTASLKEQPAIATRNHSVFSGLLIEALKGGAADFTGFITPASVYTYIDQALGPWHQRPVFKTNVSRFTSLRSVPPALPIEIFCKLTEYFPEPDQLYPLNPTYEYTNTDVANPEKVAIFKDLQKLASIGLVIPVGEEYMYWAAQNSAACRLTLLGTHYWRLIKEKKIF